MTPQYFTPYSWVTLAIFSGVLAGAGQVFAKFSGQNGMPPYLLVGIVGFVWFVASVIFMATGSITHRAFGLSNIMTFRQVLTLGTLVIISVLIAGALFWVENLARFDAINKAPYISFVLMIIELTAGVTALLLDLAYQASRGTFALPNLYQLVGVWLAILAIVFFTLGQGQKA